MASNLTRTLCDGFSITNSVVRRSSFWRQHPSSNSISLSTARSLSTSNAISLHYDWVRKSDATSVDHLVLFLHGLLGNGRNLRTLAKKYCDASQEPGVLIDIRGHGNSKLPVLVPAPSTDFHSCVQDLQATLDGMPPVVRPHTSLTLVGHSLGGRISLQYAATAPSLYPLHRVWLLDTVPGEANDSVERVVGAVTELSSQGAIADKKQLVQQLTTNYSIDLGTAQWLAASLQKTSDNSNRLEFGFDLTVVNDLLSNFHQQDFMALLEQVLQANVRVDLVRGGKNRGWSESRVKALEELQQEYPDTMGMHLLPKAGHWVHVDDLPGLLEAMDVSKK
jgi:esterase